MTIMLGYAMFQELSLSPYYSDCRDYYTDRFLNFGKATYLMDR